MRKIVIAIDGYSSCGKSTMAKDLARKIGYTYIDTGAMYRAVTCYALQHGLFSDGKIDEKALFSRVIDINGISLLTVHGSADFAIDFEVDISGIDPVCDGRDIGSVVFPDAELKVFVTASVEVRAKRRLDELVAKGENTTLEEVKKNIQMRDYIDSTRVESPLRKVDDAVVLDNSNMSIEEQDAFLLALYEERVSMF